MGRKRSKLLGPVVYFVRMPAKSNRGDPPLHARFGPYASVKEAEMKKMEEEEATGTAGYEYEYRIEAMPSALLRSK